MIPICAAAAEVTSTRFLFMHPIEREKEGGRHRVMEEEGGKRESKSESKSEREALFALANEAESVESDLSERLSTRER